MSSNYISNQLKGPAYTKEYRENLENKLLKEFTGGIEDKNIFSDSESFINYCRETYNKSGEGCSAQEFLEKYAKDEDFDYLNTLGYLIDSDENKNFDSGEMDGFFGGIYEIYQSRNGSGQNENGLSVSREAKPEGSGEGSPLSVSRETRAAAAEGGGSQPVTTSAEGFKVEDANGQTMKDYLLDNETWLGKGGARQEGNKKLSLEEIDTFFSKNNLIKDGKIDDGAFNIWFTENSGLGKNPGAHAIATYSDKIHVADVNRNNDTLDETKDIMRKAMEDLFNNKEKYADEGVPPKDAGGSSGAGKTDGNDGKSAFDTFIANSPYLDSNYKYVPTSTDGLTESTTKINKQWAKGKVDYKEYKDASGKVKQTDQYRYDPNIKQSSTIYGDNGKIQREEHYDRNGKLNHATIMDENGNKSEYCEFDGNGRVKSITKYGPDGSVLERIKPEFTGSVLTGCDHTKDDGTVERETISNGKVTQKKITTGGKASAVIIYNDDGSFKEERRYTKIDGKTVFELFDKNGKSMNKYLTLDGNDYTPKDESSKENK